MSILKGHVNIFLFRILIPTPYTILGIERGGWAERCIEQIICVAKLRPYFPMQIAAPIPFMTGKKKTDSSGRFCSFFPPFLLEVKAFQDKNSRTEFLHFGTVAFFFFNSPTKMGIKKKEGGQRSSRSPHLWLYIGLTSEKAQSVQRGKS